MNAAPLQISDEQGQAFWRAAEAAQGVQDRYQFFVWLRLHLHRFIPHDLAMCAFPGPGTAPGRAPGGDDDVQLFYSVPLARPLLDVLPRVRSRWWAGVQAQWQAGGGQAVELPLDALEATPETEGLVAEGFRSLAVHGIGDRGGVQPRGLFAFALRAPAGSGAGAAASPARGDAEAAGTAAACLAVWLPLLYCTAMRALAPARPAAEADAGPDAAVAEGADRAPVASPLTGRELQVLAAVRDAKRNAQIGELLGISPLTVKNHLRKIMRKLNAGNRAQAVAEAMSRRLIA